MTIRYVRSMFFLSGLLVMCASTPRRAAAQPISGVINKYTEVLSFEYCMNAATVGSTSDFVAGDNVLIIQMTGVSFDERDSSSFGKVTVENGIANVEFATVASVVNGVTLRFANKLLNTYSTPSTSPSGATQIIKVPVYATPTVTGTLTADPWKGQTGGVLVLQSTGAVTLNAPIDVSGLGFTGGDPSAHATGTAFAYYYPSSSDSAGMKGDGIAGTSPLNFPLDMAAGRGAIANGGGGGNADNTGGGGGSSFGAAGGNGGDQTNWPGFGRLSIGGIGGHKWLGQAGKTYIIMGGGGGGGHQNDPQTPPWGGGRGGGIAIIVAPSLISNGNAIVSNGLPGFAAKGDGAGGGGGGGCVFLQGLTGASIKVIAHGGTGGSVDADTSQYGYGPGGGGSGGAVWCAMPAPTIDCAGGIPGTISNNTAGFNGSTYGALAGDANNAPYPAATIPSSTNAYAYPGTNSKKDSVCAGNMIAISASGGISYNWSPSAGLADPTKDTQYVSPLSTTVYQVLIKRDTCLFTDTVHVEVIANTLVKPVIAGRDMLCSGETAVLTTTMKYVSYAWHDASGAKIDTTETVKVTKPGSYSVDVTNGSGCNATSVSMMVVVNKPPTPAITVAGGNNTLAAVGDSLILSIAGSYKHTLWSTKDTTPSITITDSGMYYVAVMDSNQCTGLDSIYIPLAAPQPVMTLGLQTIQAAPGDLVTLPVQIVNSNHVNALAATIYTYTLTFNKSLLAPSDPAVAATSTYNGRWRTVTVTGNRDGSGILSQVKFTAALGDTLGTPIYIDKIAWSKGRNIITSYDTGKFVLQGVCPAGGNRLFSESGTVLLNAIRPNPVHDGGTIDYSLAEPGQTELFILDMLGRKAMTILSGDAKPGDYHAIVDAASFPNGIYNVILRTPTQVFTSKMEVYH